ncbi:hypothetical protein ABIF66_009512 [Bradyrhizobium japonicum]
MTLTFAAFHAIMPIFQVVRSSLVLRSKPMIGATIPTYFVQSKAKHQESIITLTLGAGVQTRFDRRKHTQVDFNSRQFTAET